VEVSSANEGNEDLGESSVKEVGDDTPTDETNHHETSAPSLFLLLMPSIVFIFMVSLSNPPPLLDAS
jgi:hypothetical protein